MERDLTYMAVSAVGKISTHTLTWSVTDIEEYELYTENISTHTLTWSVTRYTSIDLSAFELFQLTRSRGA